MQILKRYWFLPFGILIAVLSFLWGQAESKDSQNSWDLRPHFMIQDKIFWMSSQPCGRPHPEDFTYVASIAFTQTDSTKLVTQNYEANGLLEGTPIYMNPEIPYQAYTENWRFVVEEATFRCIRHDGGIYVDSGNLYTSGTYHDDYGDMYDVDQEIESVPQDAVYIGQTKNEGYDFIPSQELGSNFEPEFCKVYQDSQNSDRLYCVYSDGKIRMHVYIPMQY